MKKRIQLTENQLRKVITEAIKEEYNGGLDWKTLYNAADKARQHGDRDRMYKFGTAARDAFAKKHNMRKTEGGCLSKGGTIDDSEPLRRQVDMSYQWDDDGYAPWVEAEISKYDQDEWDRWKDKARQEVEKYGFVASSPKPSSRRVSSLSGVSYGDKSLETPEFNDVDNFVNGRSKYIKGQGWTESVVRRVTENVIRKLTESIVNSDNKDWCGIKGVHFIWHGEWADPELEYNGLVVNYHELEDYYWADFQEEYPKPKEMSDDVYDKKFYNYLNSKGEDIISYIEDNGEPEIDEKKEKEINDKIINDLRQKYSWR